MAEGFVQLLKPRLVDLMEEQAIRFVEQGSFEPADEEVLGGEELSLQAMSSNLVGESFDGIAYTKTEGKVALVGLGFHHAQLDADLVLELKLRDMGGYWRLVEFSNVSALMEQISELTEQRLAEANAPIRRQIDETLEAREARKKRRSDRWGISKTILVEIEVHNGSDRAIEHFSGEVSLFEAGGEWIKSVSIQGDTRLEPSGAETLTWTVDVNMFDAETTRLYDLPADQVRIGLDVHRIEFSDGTELALFERLEDISARQQDPG